VFIFQDFGGTTDVKVLGGGRGGGGGGNYAVSIFVNWEKRASFSLEILPAYIVQETEFGEGY